MTVYVIERNKRSRMIAEAMQQGIARCGVTANIMGTQYYRRPESDLAVFYGYDRTMRRIMVDFHRLGRNVVYVDLGYWGRHVGGTLHGYHKVVVNGRHPTEYFQSGTHDPDRFNSLRIPIEDWRRGGEHILLGGMSAKAAEVEGFRPEQWERLAIKQLRLHTDRPIIYRPKPSWMEAKPIEGTEFRPGLDDLDGLLKNCHAVVTHHSNVAIDGMLKGVPAFCVSGAPSVISLSDLSRIETPWRPDTRREFCEALAFTQWRPAEMRSGVVWKYLTETGLI